MRNYMLVPDPGADGIASWLFKKYSGAPAHGGESFDRLMESRGGLLTSIAAAADGFRDAADRLTEAFSKYGSRRDEVAALLRTYFSNQCGWTYDLASAAVEAFDRSGFSSEQARDFAMFVRGLFFDDGLEAFRNVSCVGLSSRNGASRVEWEAVATFEDSASGNQFALVLPFPDVDEIFGSRAAVDCWTRLSYRLVCPRSGRSFSDSSTEVASYDVRVMRRALDKFVVGGCKMSRPEEEYESYMYLPQYGSMEDLEARWRFMESSDSMYTESYR